MGREGQVPVHDGLELDRRQTAEAGLPASPVVGAFDPSDDRDAQFLPGAPRAPVQNVLLKQEPDDQKGHRKRRGSRGGRPVGLDVADYKNRNVIEHRYCHFAQWRGLATRYARHAVIYRAAVVLNAVIAWTKTVSDTP